MNQPIRQQPPSFVPLLQWLEDQRVLPQGTVREVHTLADKVKGFGDALKRGGIVR